MKNLWILAVLVGAVVGGKHVVEKSLARHSVDESQRRVKTLLENLKSGDEQTALCVWAAGSLSMSQDGMRAFTDRFDAWRKEKALAKVDAFQVDDAAAAAGSGSVRVSATVNGQHLAMDVRGGEPIAWAP